MRLTQGLAGRGHVLTETAGGRQVRPVVVSVLRLQLDNSPAGHNLQLVARDQGGTGGQLTGVQTLSTHRHNLHTDILRLRY